MVIQNQGIETGRIEVFDRFVTSFEKRRDICLKIRQILVKAVKESLDERVPVSFSQSFISPNYFPPSHYVNFKFLVEHFGKMSQYCRGL